MAAEFERDSGGPKRLCGGAKKPLRLLIHRSHDGAAIDTKLGRGDSCSGQPDDEHALSFQFESSPHLRYLSFKVVSENSAKTSAKIQKRTMIFDSLHPMSSK